MTKEQNSASVKHLTAPAKKLSPNDEITKYLGLLQSHVQTCTALPVLPAVLTERSVCSLYYKCLYIYIIYQIKYLVTEVHMSYKVI